jgi:hypothetical protein
MARSSTGWSTLATNNTGPDDRRETAAMSALGQKRTLKWLHPMSPILPKADMGSPDACISLPFIVHRRMFHANGESSVAVRNF